MSDADCYVGEDLCDVQNEDATRTRMKTRRSLEQGGDEQGNECGANCQLTQDVTGPCYRDHVKTVLHGRWGDSGRGFLGRKLRLNFCYRLSM